MSVRHRSGSALVPFLMGLTLLIVRTAFGQAPALNTIFPAGGRAGGVVDVTVGGSNLSAIQELRCSLPAMRCERLDANRFRLTFPPETKTGLYDISAVGTGCLSAPRTFAIGHLTETIEAEPNDVASAMSISLDSVINGQIDKPADVDHFQFTARRGQRIVVECLAERIDSRLRGVLEIFDLQGRRLAVNRGYFGPDPLIDFEVPTDGTYLIKLQDLTSSGSAEHYYRLEVDTGPRVAFSIPTVIERGQEARVTLYGWNLNVRKSTPAPLTGSTESTGNALLDGVEVNIPASLAEPVWPLPVRLQPAQAVLAGASFPYSFPGSHAPVVIGVTDVPVFLDRPDNHSAATAQDIVVPSEVSGQLIADDERDWYVFTARRGEVLFLEAYGQRIASPVDLQIGVLDASGQREYAQFSDSNNIGHGFPTSHLDPAGRWVCPADGRYLISVRNLSGGVASDPRRTYRLSLRRADPDFHVLAIPHGTAPTALNVPRSGRQVLDLLAFRHRGFDGPIRVSAKDLPVGMECPDVWLGPGVSQAVLVVSADPHVATPLVSNLDLEATSDGADARIQRTVTGGTLVRSGTPLGWGRLTSQIPFAVVADAPIRLIANGHETIEHHLYGKLSPRHSPGGILDVAIQIERRDTLHQAPVKLIGVELPESIPNQTAIIPAGQSKGAISFVLPTTLPVGRFSLAIRAETTVPAADKKVETIVVHSDPVTIDVQPAAFVVEVDPFAVKRARRGETLRIPYTSRRINGFIGKMHTELAMPGRVTDVPGLRGRGETFVGQTESGSLQIVVNDDAPLGPQSFLRLFTVGVVEDEPIFQGSRLLDLEIVE